MTYARPGDSAVKSIFILVDHLHHLHTHASQPSMIDRWTDWLIPGAHFISINPSPESSVSVSVHRTVLVQEWLNHISINSGIHHFTTSEECAFLVFLSYQYLYILCHCPWSRSIYYLFRDRSIALELSHQAASNVVRWRDLIAWSRWLPYKSTQV